MFRLIVISKNLAYLGILLCNNDIRFWNILGLLEKDYDKKLGAFLKSLEIKRKVYFEYLERKKN